MKLIDFGIAKAANKVTRTQAGTIKGKYGYMSPEQVRGVEIDHRADIFALGICMWELFTLQRLFAADNELLVLDRIRDMSIVAPSTFNPDVTSELDRIILKALAKDPNERYRATKDLYRDINALPESCGTRDDVSKYMRRAFPEAAGSRPPSVPSASVGGPRQETRAMSAENKSDLDIFEGLGKKSGSGRASQSSVPAPPRSSSSMPAVPGQSAQPPVNDVAGNKKTLLGMQSPSASSIPAAAGARPTPPPPPGRGTLPPVVPPPPKGGSTPPGTVARNGNGNAGGKGRGALDMDWDDEDEATHVFDKGDHSQGRLPAEAPAMDPTATVAQGKGRTLLGVSGALAAPPPPPPPPTPSQAPFRSVPPPLPPASNPPFRSGGSGHPQASPSQPPSFRTPPPPPSGGAFARASGSTSHAPGPVSYGNGAPAAGANGTAPMRMPSSLPPPGGSTAPMPMPSRPSTGSTASVGSVPPRSIEATQMVRPQASRNGMWIGLGVVFAAIVAGAVYMTTPKTGKVVVNVTDEKGAALNRVEIFIDGKKMCDTAPCFIEQVNAGAHEVKVISEGYDVPPARSIGVESRKDTALSFALPPAAGSKSGTGIKVSGNQSGVKLLVDDKEVGPLPQEVRDLTPGSHKIKLMGSDRYAPMEKNVTVAQNEMQDLGPQMLKVVKGKATITLGTPGAKVYIVSGADRHEVPTFPISIDIDTAKQWSLEATKAGFVDYKQSVGFEDGQAEKAFTVALDPKGAAPSAVPAAVPQAPVAAAAPIQKDPTPAAPPRAPVAAKDPPAPKAPATAAKDPDNGSAAATGESFLDINSMPSSSVVLDGKPIGNTPRLHVSVSPGTHAVLFINAEQGLKKTVSVSVGAGETKKAIAKLRD